MSTGDCCYPWVDEVRAEMARASVSNNDEATGSGSSNGDEKAVNERKDEPVQHIHAKTVILLIVSRYPSRTFSFTVTDNLQAVVGVYFVQVVHLTGIGVLAQTITAEIGGLAKSTWLAETVAITAGTLSPPVSQAADLWGRKWFVVGFTVCGAVGCLILSRANNFGQLIAGQCTYTRVTRPQPIDRQISPLTQEQQSVPFTPELNASSTPSPPKSSQENGAPSLKLQQQQQEA